jgi:hypothetical protein
METRKTVMTLTRNSYRAAGLIVHLALKHTPHSHPPTLPAE